MQLTYEELRQMAQRYMRRHPLGHTFQTTELIHEAYLKIARVEDHKWQNRTHFFGMAANMMRRILVNYAVNQNRLKRGSGDEQLQFEEALCVAAEDRDIDLLALDKALLNDLAKLDERQVQIVELRFFSGLSIEETVEVLQILPATVKRD